LLALRESSPASQNWWSSKLFLSEMSALEAFSGGV
jgi:hypothetical protein